MSLKYINYDALFCFVFCVLTNTMSVILTQSIKNLFLRKFKPFNFDSPSETRVKYRLDIHCLKSFNSFVSVTVFCQIKENFFV